MMRIWGEGRVEAAAEVHASVLVQWLAAEASASLRAGMDPSPAVAHVGREPGVTDAVILKPEDGQILAPTSRGAERVAQLPGVGVVPNDVWRVRTARSGGLVEAVAPVALPGQPRGAVAWLRYRPAESTGSPLGTVVLALVLATALGFGVASEIRRNTERALAALNENLELAASGRLAQVTDTMGIRALKDLADTLNYLLVRLKSDDRDGSGHSSASEPAVRPERPVILPEAATDAAGPPQLSKSPPAAGIELIADDRTRVVGVPTERPVILAPPAPEDRPARSASGLTARIVASAAYRVTEAGPECAEVVGVGPDAMVSQHLLDAIPDKAIVDGILRCLSTLPDSGEERTVVTPERVGNPIEVTVRRSARDEPITILLGLVVDAGRQVCNT